MSGFESNLSSGVTGSISKIAKVATVALAGIGIGAAVAAVGKIGMAYQDTMNNLQAVSGATAKQMAAVGKTAKELGADTSLTATSAADAAVAMTELAKGGLSVDDAMKAAKGTLQLASAAGIEAGQAATIQSAALNAFSLSADKAGHVSDVLANAANAAAGEMTDFSYGLQASGSVAHALGISLEDTATTLGILANNGIKGSDAGTLLKSALLALESPSKQAKQAMEDLGLKAFDAKGNFVGLDSIFGQLQKSSKSMTKEQYAAATSTLFGSDAARLAGVAAKEGSEGFEKMSAAMGREGSAADVAQAKSKGLHGAIESFKSQIETFQIDLYERFAPAVEKVVRFASDTFPKIGDAIIGGIDKGLDWATNTFAPAIAGVFDLLVKGDFTGKFAQAFHVEEDAPVVGVLLTIHDGIVGIFDLLVKGDFSSKLAQAFNIEEDNPVVGFVLDARDKVIHIWDNLPNLWTGLDVSGITEKVAGALADVGGSLIGGITTGFETGDWSALGQAIVKALGQALDGIATLAGKVNSAMTTLVGKIDWFGIALDFGKQVPTLLVGLATGILNFDLGSLLKGLGDHWFEVLLAVVGVALAPAKFIGKFGELLAKIPLVGKLLEWGLNAFKSFADNAVGWIGDVVTSFGRGLLGEGGGPIAGFFKTAFENVKTYLFVWGDDTLAWFKGIPGRFLEIIEEFGGQLRTAFSKIAGFVTGIVRGLVDDAVHIFEPITSRLLAVAETARTWVVGKITALKDGIVGIARDAIEGVMSFFGNIGSRMLSAAETARAWVTGKLSDLKTGAVNILHDLVENAVSFFGGLPARLLGVAENARSWLVGKFNDLKSGVTGIFTDIRDTVGRIWDGLNDKIKTPLRVVFDFVNSKMVGPVNTILSKFPGGLKIPELPHLASGGLLKGPGTGTSDSILGIDAVKGIPTAAVSTGEFVVNAKSTKRNLGLLHAINSGLPGYARGGEIGGPLDWISSAASKVKDVAGNALDFAGEVVKRGARKAAEFILNPIADAAKALIPDAVPFSLLSGGIDKLVSAVLGKGDEADKANAAEGFAGGGAGGTGGGLDAGWSSIFNMVKAAIPSARVNSAYRPGDPGYHGKGKAVDMGFGGVPGGNGSAGLASINRFLYDTVGGKLAELIYDGIGDDRPDIKNGANHAYNAATTAAHHNHVHAAVYDRGGVLRPGGVGINLGKKPERVLDGRQTEAFDKWMSGAATTAAPLVNELHVHVGDGASVKDGLAETNFYLRRIKRGAGIP